MVENRNSEIKDNIIDFFNSNARECIKLLKKADSSNINQIYEFKNNIAPNDVKNLFAQAEILILTANKYETNILHYNIAKKMNTSQGENKRIRKIK